MEKLKVIQQHYILNGRSQGEQARKMMKKKEK